MKSKMIVHEDQYAYYFTFFKHGKWQGECKVVFEDDEVVILEGEWSQEAEATVYCDWAKRTAEMMEEKEWKS